jgi:hypothetical protein
MKKSQQQKQGLFEMIERQSLADMAGRRGFMTSQTNVPRELKILDRLKARKKKGESLTRIEKTLDYHLHALAPGKKYPLMARNSIQAKMGKRFMYVGVDGELHIGRNGKPLKVDRKLA